MLIAPVFLAPEEWVAPPADWARTGIQQGKRYELDTGEGRRILDACVQRARAGARYWNVEPSPQLVAEGAPRFGSPIPVRPRLGQGVFSLAVRDAYGGACAVTGEHSGPVLEAAHIKPYGKGGEHRVDNGLLLRRDLHRLYDLGYVTVTPDYEFRVGERLREEFKNGRSYYGLSGSRIAVPANEGWRPRREFLDWHGQAIFKG
jgi:putative restriction endonuclease